MTEMPKHELLFGANSRHDRLTDDEALGLADERDLARLCHRARNIRDQAYGSTITYSRKVFVPLTQLCRDVCHYCTFATTPGAVPAPYLSVDQAVAIARQGKAQGCKEALFTLGEKPELRFNAAREALDRMGYETTLEYLRDVADAVFQETGLLPHLNAGCMTDQEFQMLRPVSASMGVMLETASDRLSEKGGPHYGSPDKTPAAKLETIARAGNNRVPFTSGILIGIGETRRERIGSLLALRALSDRYGHLQEVIIQNFRAKPGTKMAAAAEPDIEDILWTIATARIILDPKISIQAPPNLNADTLAALVDAGINDWGGLSPVTIDHVNPEAPWPEFLSLTSQTESAGKDLAERLTVYPRYIRKPGEWIDESLRKAVIHFSDSEGLARCEDWTAGRPSPIPEKYLLKGEPRTASAIQRIVEQAKAGNALVEGDIATLFAAQGRTLEYICEEADTLRREVVGDGVSFVVNRNINYTNICTFSCSFCAFSKGKTQENLRGRPYNLSFDEIASRAQDAWDHGATEVCLQGGIHPKFTGETYLEICRQIRAAVPQIHIHAFSPLEVWHGATSLGIDLPEYLRRLKAAGLNTLPGTAAEILDDDMRAILCPDKLTTDLWLDIIAAAHAEGFNTTATIMFGHVDEPVHWARHLIRIRGLQEQSIADGKGRFTEFVPLPFVHMESPIHLKSTARLGPTFRESLLMHAIARLVLHPVITNIQASWTKLGPDGAALCLDAGVNDLGGTLMDESIARAAGASHGQNLSAADLTQIISSAGRSSWQRTTEYQAAKSSSSPNKRNRGTVVTKIDSKRRHSEKLTHSESS